MTGITLKVTIFVIPCQAKNVDSEKLYNFIKAKRETSDFNLLDAHHNHDRQVAFIEGYKKALFEIENEIDKYAKKEQL